MSLTPESLSAILDLLYEAAADPDRWPDFLNIFCAHAQATRAYFLLQDSDTHRDFSVQIGFTEEEQRDYVAHYAQHDILFQRIVEAQQRAGGDWICERSALVPESEYRKSVIFNEFILPAGPTHVAAAALSGLPGMAGGIGIQRPQTHEPFGQETLSLITIIAPHLKRAIGFHRMLGKLRDENQDLRQTIEHLNAPIVSTDPTGRVLQTTESARRILETRDGLYLSHRRLAAAAHAENSRLESLIRGASATGSGAGADMVVEYPLTHSPQAGRSARWSAPSGGAMLISRRPPKRPLQLVVYPFHSSSVFIETRPSALVFLIDPHATPPARGELLRALYGLTPTESRLTDLLTAGLELKTAAEHLRLTQNTARFHLKAIFRKTATRSQSNLIRLALSLPGTR